MLNFETRTGPNLGLDTGAYPTQGVPDWYRDSKLGFFVHWGLFSVPAWARVPGGPPVPVEDAYAHHQYAEWYGNTVRIAGSPTWTRHQEVFGPGVSYEDLADMWDVRAFDANAFIDELVDAGAQYIVPTTKHHDGFCLWDTATTRFAAPHRGPGRDLIAELHAATTRAGARFGVYFSGALDWHVSDFPAIESDTDLFRYRRNDAHFSRYAAAQLDELIERFAPDLLWNDIDWPDGGKGSDDFGLAALLARYFRAVPHGVVNDRWGIPYHGFLTREYTDVTQTLSEPWESTRGLGASFGFNQVEDESNSLSGADLVRHLIDVVSKNGNLLINVGPRADGSIPDVQRSAMRELGGWLGVNGRSIFGTRPWIRPNEQCGTPRAYTATEEHVFVHILDPVVGHIDLPSDISGGHPPRWADGSVAEVEPGQRVIIPDALRASPAAVLSVPSSIGSTAE